MFNTVHRKDVECISTGCVPVDCSAGTACACVSPEIRLEECDVATRLQVSVSAQAKSHAQARHGVVCLAVCLYIQNMGPLLAREAAVRVETSVMLQVQSLGESCTE
jgi:hypothetical protein